MVRAMAAIGKESFRVFLDDGRKKKTGDHVGASSESTTTDAC